MLRRAEMQDIDTCTALWLHPQNAQWIEPPEAGELASAIAQGWAFLWHEDGQSLGLATLMCWVPQVMGLSCLTTTRPGIGKPLLQAVLAEVFGPMAAHRIGLDVTCDNARAIRLYESLGFQREGVVRECWHRPQGDWTDCALYGLLAHEYQP